MSMGGGSSSTVQKADPWEGQQPYLRDIYGKAQTASDQTNTSPYGGNFVTQANPYEQAAPASMASYAKDFMGLGDSTIKLGQDTANGMYLDPSTNKYLEGAVRGATAPIFQQMGADQMKLGTNAAAQGAYGGSRQALLEGQIAKSGYDAAGSVANNMYSTQYENERKLQTMAPALTQSGMTMNLMSPQLQAQAGQMQHAIDDYSTQNGLQQFQDSIQAPWRAVSPYSTVVAGMGAPGGTTTSTGPQSSPIVGGLGGAMSGAALGSMIPGVGTLLGAGLGGLMGIFK